MDDGLQHNTGLECKEFYDNKAKKEALDKKKQMVFITDNIYSSTVNISPFSGINYKQKGEV